MDLFGKLDFGWKMRGRHALDWYNARLMPAVEDTEEPLGYGCFSISRGIKGICKERVSGKINVWVPCEKHKNENSHRGVPSIFLLLLKSPESLVYFYPWLVRCHHGTARSMEKFVVHLWYHSQSCFVLSRSFMDGTSELEYRAEQIDGVS